MKIKKNMRILLVSIFGICLFFVGGCGKTNHTEKPRHTARYLAAEREFNVAYEEMQALFNLGVTSIEPCHIYHPYKTRVEVALGRYDRSIGDLKYAAYAEGNETDKDAYDSDKIRKKMTSNLRAKLLKTIRGDHFSGNNGCIF